MDVQDRKNDTQPPRYNGRIWGGLFLLALGGIFLMKEMSYPLFPHWFFRWPMILIAVGIFSGLKHGFRGGGWFVLLLVGGFFLMDEVTPEFNLHRYIVPFIIICVGLGMLLRPRRRDEEWMRRRYDWRCQRREWRRNRHRQWDAGQPYQGPQPGQTNPEAQPQQPQDWSAGPVPPPPAGGPAAGSQNTGSQANSQTNNNEDYLDSVSVFGGVRRVIMSKNFRGGEATSFMGGTELDFSQADINGTVSLELTQVMGGAKLIVPGHWSVRNEVNAVLGGVDDKRQFNTVPDPNKVLVLKGTSFLGGLEIRNF